ncbi:MAG: carboxypeptidase-like regulatory domain-containing protein [bacterium]
MANSISRGIEVLVKKAAVDPAFKKMLLEKRAEAAEAIALELEPAEAAMLNAVPVKQLAAIVANTKVNPGLRPAFLGYAAAAMLAALGTGAYAENADEWEMRTTGIDPEIPPKTFDYNINDPEDIDVPDDAGIIYGRVRDQFDEPASNVFVEIEEVGLETVTNRYGFYVLSPIPPGIYTLTFHAESYESERRSNIEVKKGVKTEVSVKLIQGPGEHSITGIRPDLP